MTEQQQSQLDLAGFFQILRSRLWLIIGIALLAAGAAFGLSKLQDDTYEATAEMQFEAPEPPPRIDPNEPPPDIPDAPDRVAATNLALASLDSVVLRVKETVNSPLSIDELRDKVEIEPKGQADIVSVTASAPTAAGAARLANAFAEEISAVRRERAQEEIRRVAEQIESQLPSIEDPAAAAEFQKRANQLKIQANVATGDVRIAQEAVPPIDPSAPKPVRNAVIGGALGLLLGILLVLLLSRFSRKVDDEREAAEIIGAPIIARIPEEKSQDWEQQLFVEAFQFLRANLQMRSSAGKEHVIAVTSALPEQGKSTVAGRLAVALVLTGADVILVDCDLRRPTLHVQFGVDASQGVTTAFAESKDPSELLQETSLGHLKLLPAGPLIPMLASVMAGTDTIRRMVDKLRPAADYVIIDTSPITVGAEASAITAAADGTLFVVEAQGVDRDVLDLASDQLRASHAKVMGVVVNRAPVLLKDQVYRGYYTPGLQRESAKQTSEPAPVVDTPNGRGLFRRRRQKDETTEASS